MTGNHVHQYAFYAVIPAWNYGARAYVFECKSCGKTQVIDCDYFWGSK